MQIQPVSQSRSYADVVRSGEPPQQLPPEPSSAPADQLPPPPIVNSDALHLCKRRKVLDTSGEAIFNAMHECLRKYSSKKELTDEEYECSARQFRKNNPELYDYVLANGAEARESSALHGLNRNGYLAQKVKETLYWLPGIADHNKPLSPEIICGIVRKYIMKEWAPEEIALELTQKLKLVYALTEIPFHILEEYAVLFSQNDLEGVRFLLPDTLSHLYLHALKATELMSLMWTYEGDRGDAMSRLLQITTPKYWEEIAGGECTSWAAVMNRFNESISQPLRRDRPFLQSQERQLRTQIAHLKELERILSLNQEQMLFLADRSFGVDQITPLFPECQVNFRTLFSRFPNPGEFDCKGLLVAMICRFQECRELLSVIRPPKSRETPREVFYSCNDRAIYQAGLQLLSGLVEGPGTEEFLYACCYEYFGMDLNEWMQHIIAALPVDSLLSLSKKINQIGLKGEELMLKESVQAELLTKRRGDFLSCYLRHELKLPQDLAAFKSRFVFQEGATA